MQRNCKPYKWNIQLILIYLFIVGGIILYQNNANALDLQDPSIDLGICSPPPVFTDNTGIIVIKNHQDGNWRYHIAPYLASQRQNNYCLGISEAYLAWDNDVIGFDIGRKIITHGPGRYGYPVLGPLGSGLSAEGYDQIGYHFTWGNLKAQKFYALVSESFFRMLVGQRLTYDLGPITFGVTEDILVRKEAPLSSYVPIPFYPNTNAVGENKIIDFDLTWRATDTFQLYVQYFIDDIPLESSKADKYGWRCGYQGGFNWQNAFHNPNITLYTEYTRVNQYTYTHDWDGLNWTYKGFLLGDLGPDADRFNMELVWKQSSEWQWSFAYQRIRRGEGKIGDPFIYVPGRTVVFLTGTVETTDLLAVGITRKNQGYDINCTLGLAKVQNSNHVDGDTKFEPKVSVNAKIYLP